MPKRKPKGDVVDLAAVREEIDAIRREALTYGFSLDGDQPLAEIRKVIAKIREERAGKPPCYRRAYLATAPQCRVCDLARECTQDEVPAYVPPEDLVEVTCARCKQGTLTIELKDPASGSVRDYGCTTSGCPQTLLDQQQFLPPPASQKPQCDEKKEKRQTNVERKTVGMSTGQLDKEVLELLKNRGVIPTKKVFVELIPAGRQRIQRRLDVLVQKGTIRYRHKKGFWIPKRKRD